MPYGEGHSVKMWLKYLPKAKISIFEFNGACAENFWATDPLGIGPDLKARSSLYVGDQKNPEDLKRAIEGAGAPFDVIVDDGEMRGRFLGFVLGDLPLFSQTNH
jgi:hypothetical protein